MIEENVDKEREKAEENFSLLCEHVVGAPAPRNRADRRKILHWLKQKRKPGDSKPRTKKK